MGTVIYTGHKRPTFQNNEPKIQVIGIGSAGSNIVNALYAHQLHAELITINTDWKASAQKADTKLLIGKDATKGFGCGGDHLKGQKAATESLQEIKKVVNGEFAFIIGGLGNGTATGGIPIIAEQAKKTGALTVAVLIIPFFMKKGDTEKIETALDRIKNHVDTCVVLDLNQLKAIYSELPLSEAFTVMNHIVETSIASLVSVIRERDLMKINFSELKSLFIKGGFATIGMAETTDSPTLLVQSALSNKLYHYEPKDAKGALVYLCGAPNTSLEDIRNAAENIKDFVDKEADILLGIHPTKDALKMKALVVLTGMKNAPIQKELEKMIDWI